MDSSPPRTDDLRYTKLTAFTRFGPADMLLIVEVGGTSLQLLVHQSILGTFSPVLRDVMLTTTREADPVTGLDIIRLGGDSIVDWCQGLTAIYMQTEGATDTDQWSAMLKERHDQAKSAEAMLLWADHYNISSVGQLARRAVCGWCLKPQPGEPTNLPRGNVEPWMLAYGACQRNDPDLVKRCMSTVCEPLEGGFSITGPPAHLKLWAGPMVNDLVSEVNKAVAEIPSKLASGVTNTTLCNRLAVEVGSLQERIVKLEASKASLFKQLEVSKASLVKHLKHGKRKGQPNGHK